MAFSPNEKEDSSLNQYWYSPETIRRLVEEIQLHATSCAFLSTPSLYFALQKVVDPNSPIAKNSKLFEYDRRWSTDPNFVFYDFNQPDQVPAGLWEAFDFVVVDPPFITREVWAKYAETIRLILKPKGGKVLLTSVIENHPMLEDVTKLQLMVPLFRPSIPHLVYQYHCFVNYPTARLDTPNPELPPEDPKLIEARHIANGLRESAQQFHAQMQQRDRTGEQPLPAQGTMAQKAACDKAHQPTFADDPAMLWKRVPEGLTEYPDGATAPPPSSQESTDYGDEYRAIEKSRCLMEDFKKQVDALFKEADSVIKGEAALLSSDPAAKAAARAKLDAAVKRRDEHLDGMKSVVRELEQVAAQRESAILALMHSCVQKLSTTTIDQTTYRELAADATRHYKSPIFSRQKELLAEMKQIKKTHNNTSGAPAACSQPSVHN